MTQRIYKVTIEGEPPREFTNYRAAGVVYRSLRDTRPTKIVHATTWLRTEHGDSRLDETGATPMWALDPNFSYSV